jgi:hypothetical protein
LEAEGVMHRMIHVEHVDVERRDAAQECFHQHLILDAGDMNANAEMHAMPNENTHGIGRSH